MESAKVERVMFYDARQKQFVVVTVESEHAESRDTESDAASGDSVGIDHEFVRA